MTLLIFAGTKNGRELAHILAKEGHRVHVSSASDYGRKFLGHHANITSHVGKLTQEAMKAMVIGLEVQVVIDATHPYAVEVSDNLISLSKVMAFELIRYERGLAVPKELGTHVPDMASACAYIADKEGRALFTTGVKGLANMLTWLSADRFYVRILPVEGSLATVRDLGLSMDRVIAANPPFSLEDNLSLIRSLEIKYLVTKDSGQEGNIREKIQAVKETGVELIVIDRPSMSWEHIYYEANEIKEMLNHMR